METLTPREIEVIVTMFKNDFGVKQVADYLNISPFTADTHLKNSKKKKNVRTLSGLVFKVLKQHKNLLASLLIVIQMAMCFSIGEDNYRKGKRLRNSRTKIARKYNG